MTSRNTLDAFAAARGEGLHPRLRELFDRSAARPFSELTVRDGMLQAGPDPASDALAVPSNTATSRGGDDGAPSAIRSIRGGRAHPARR